MFGGQKSGKRAWEATGKFLTFPVSSCAKETMQPYITRYTKAKSLYYTNDWFSYAFLPVRGNHVLGILKVQDHLNGIETFWSAAKHWQYNYRGIQVQISLFT